MFSAIGSISEGWSPIAEISTYVAFLSAGFQVENSIYKNIFLNNTIFQISSIILMPVSGVLCESQLGWRYIFYLFGGISVIAHIIFFTFFRDSATVHR